MNVFPIETMICLVYSLESFLMNTPIHFHDEIFLLYSIFCFLENFV